MHQVSQEFFPQVIASLEGSWNWKNFCSAWLKWYTLLHFHPDDDCMEHSVETLTKFYFNREPSFHLSGSQLRSHWEASDRKLLTVYLMDYFSYPCLIHCTSCNRLNLLFLVRTWLTAHTSIIIATTSIWCADSWEVALKKSWFRPNTIEIIDDGPVTRVLSKMRIKESPGSCGRIEYNTNILWRNIHTGIQQI